MKKLFTWISLISLIFSIISCDIFSEVDEVVVESKKTTEEIIENEKLETEGEDSEQTENTEADEEKSEDKVNDTENENQNESLTETTESEEKDVEEEKGNEKNTDTDTSEILEMSGENVVEVQDRKWTIFVYMSADNQLESAALEDLYEMQNSGINDSEVTIVALIDRSSRYNSSNGDWTGTKLFRIRTGKKVNTTEILSDELDCRPLGLTAGSDVELEMASSYTLSTALSYVMTKFPAEKYGFIMWGHGTGWRGAENQASEEMSSIYKGFAFDESSGTYMTLKQLGTALKTTLDSNKLDFLGFDTCFSGELEVAYELRNCTKYFVGSEGLLSSSGWNYKKLFDEFNACEDLSEENLCKSVVLQFSQQYENTPEASICAIKMEKLESYFSAFNNFCLAAGKSIKSMKIHDEVLGVVYTNADCTTVNYSYGASGYDIYLDINSLVDNLTTYFSTTTLKKLCKAFKTSQEELNVDFWTFDKKSGGLGVYFSTYGEGGVLVSNHPSSYISGKTINQIDFVLDCTGYVPLKDTSYSFLDSLFYRDFS